MVEQTLRSHMKLKKHFKNATNNYFFQSCRQHIKNTTELLMTEPSGSTPSVHEKQLKLALNSP